MSSCLFEGDSHLHKLLVVRVAKADSQDKIPAAQGTNFLQEFRHKAKTAQKLPFIAILSCACLADLAKVHAMVCVQLNAVESCLLAAQGCVHKGFLVALKVLPGDGGNTVFRHGGKASEHDLRKGHGHACGWHRICAACPQCRHRPQGQGYPCFRACGPRNRLW